MDPRLRDLAKMALDYLTVPSMSAEPERMISAAKLTLSDRRCRGLGVLEELAERRLDCRFSVGYQRIGGYALCFVPGGS